MISNTTEAFSVFSEEAFTVRHYGLMTVFKTDSTGEICFSKAC